MGEYIVNHISDKGLLSRIHKELLKLKNKKGNPRFKKVRMTLSIQNSILQKLFLHLLFMARGQAI